MTTQVVILADVFDAGGVLLANGSTVSVEDTFAYRLVRERRARYVTEPTAPASQRVPVYREPSGALVDEFGSPVSGGGAGVGGYAVGAAGMPGSMYAGYTLSWADDFEALDILSPANSRGRWYTTRTYLPGSRGSDTLLGTMYDTDPLMTGHNDSNRGVPVGYSNMSVESSVLSLQARKSTAAEQIHMSSARPQVGAMISGAGAVHWYPDAAKAYDVIFEARIKFSTGNPAGWHPTLWLQSLNPVIAVDSDEWDWEGSSQGAYLNRNLWTGGSATSTTYAGPYLHDGQYHIVSFVLNASAVVVYVDGVLYATAAAPANAKAKPQYPLVTSHVYSGTYEGEAYSLAAWNADADGATISVDWMRIWRRTGRAHWAPRVSIADRNVAYGSSLTITLPSKEAIWGDSSVTEYLQAIYHEENEPGVDHTSAYTQFPPGVTYDSGTRQLTVNITSGKTGRINFALAAWDVGGSTGEPMRFSVNVGPRVLVSALQFVPGAAVSFDLYAQCDCGVLTSDGSSRAKTISVTGLAGSGLSYSDTTGMLTGTFVDGTYSLGVTVTNSVGQSATATVAVTGSVLLGYAYESWTDNGVGWYDTSSIIASGSDVTALVNRRTGQGDMTAIGAARTLVSAAQNGRAIISLTRNTANPAGFEAPIASAVSAACQGSDKPYTVILVYRPTDANTGYPWSWSDTVDGQDAQKIALVRRASSACSVRRMLATATSNDVSWGSGQAANAWRIVAVKHTGTAVSVWDTSTTAALTASAQDVATFNASLQFRIGAVEGPGSTDPSYDTVCCAMDFAECIVQSAARTDAEIQTAISNLATKWGITLS